MNHAKLLKEAFEALDNYNKKGAGKMHTPAINTIMTLVVRLQETVVVSAPGYNHQYIEWNKQYAEPQVIYPAMDSSTPVEHGIVGVIAWLRELPEGSSYHVYTKRVVEPLPKAKNPDRFSKLQL